MCASGVDSATSATGTQTCPHRSKSWNACSTPSTNARNAVSSSGRGSSASAPTSIGCWSAINVLDLPVYDSQCGAKLFRADLAEVLFGEPFVTSWLFDVELLARLRNAVGREAVLASVIEVPLGTWVDVKGSKLRAAHMVQVPIQFWKIHARYNKG
jgi:hypothetical protein